VVDATLLPVYGGALRVLAGAADPGGRPGRGVAQVRDAERAAGLDRLDTYRRFGEAAVEMPWRHRLSPLAIASRLGVPASTVSPLLVRCRLNRLSHLDIRAGEPIRRYEHDHPGSLIHVDVKKLGNIPDGGGWRFVGRAQGKHNRRLTPGTQRMRYREGLLGHAFSSIP
jgi:hypothetical protein